MSEMSGFGLGRENARKLDRDGRGHSSKTDLAVKLASALNVRNKPKKLILAAFRSIAFSHSQAQEQSFQISPPDG